jgi:hypothetical protein
VKVTVFVRVQLPVNVTVSRTLYTPEVVGVPEIVGCDAFGMDKPGGNPVALYVCGLPVVVIVYVNATPTIPVASPLLMLWLLHAPLPVTTLARRKSNGKIVLIDQAKCDQEPVNLMAVWVRQAQQMLPLPPDRARPLRLSC